VSQPAARTKTTPTPPVDPLWMLEDRSYGMETAFLSSLGARFGGEPCPTAGYALDMWGRAQEGLRWVLTEAPMAPITIGRGMAVVGYCAFIGTQDALKKRAVAEFGGDLEAAIRRSLHESLTTLGLKQYQPGDPRG
jgi:hypothetical protein